MSFVFIAGMIIGLVVSIVGSLMWLFAAFRESVLWGLACVVIPFASLVFLIKYWDSAKRGFLVSMSGTVIVLVSGLLGALVAPAKATDVEPQLTSSSQRSTQLASTAYTGSAEWNEPESSATTVAAVPGAPVREAAAPRKPFRLLGRSDAPEEKPETRAGSSRSESNTIEKVWVDRAARVYYTDTCKTRPGHAVRIAKSVAVMQGFSLAPCE